MKTSIEEIDGKLYTVVWKGEIFDLYKVCNPYTDQESGVIYFASSFGSITATALPALPKHPIKEHVQLLHRYMSEGIYPKSSYAMPKRTWYEPVIDLENGVKYKDENGEEVDFIETIFGATDKDGNKVEVAIK